MDVKTIGIIVGIITGCFAVAAPIVKWLLNDWFNKTKEIEKLKAQQTANLLDRFKRDIDALGVKLRAFEQRLNDYDRTAVRMQANVEMVSSLVTESIQSAERISSNLKGEIKEAVKTELINLKNKAVMVKTKQGGTNGK